MPVGHQANVIIQNSLAMFTALLRVSGMKTCGAQPSIRSPSARPKIVVHVASTRPVDVTGDRNNNNVVDDADYVLWRNTQ
jgi:hypothetical protein